VDNAATDANAVSAVSATNVDNVDNVDSVEINIDMKRKFAIFIIGKWIKSDENSLSSSLINLVVKTLVLDEDIVSILIALEVTDLHLLFIRFELENKRR